MKPIVTVHPQDWIGAQVVPLIQLNNNLLPRLKLQRF